MKVSELIEELKNFDMDSEVHFSYNYGDHWRTTVAPIVKNIDEGTVIHSGYHNMPKVVDDGEEEDKDTRERHSVVILSA